MIINVKEEAHGLLARVKAKVNYELDAANERIVKYNEKLQEKNDNYLRSIGASEAEIESMNDYMDETSKSYYGIYTGVGQALYNTQSAKVRLVEDAISNIDLILDSDEIMSAVGERLAEEFNKKTGLNINNFYPFDELPDKLSLVIGQDINQKAGVVIFTNGVLPAKEAFKQIKNAAVLIVNKETGLHLTTIQRPEVMHELYVQLKSEGVFAVAGYAGEADSVTLGNRMRQRKYRLTHKQNYTGYTAI